MIRQKAFTLIELPAMRKGFTLIELLVVVTLIIALLALLLPSLTGAVNAAESATCQAHMHQLVLAYNNYASDHFGIIVKATTKDNDESWVGEGAGPEPIKSGRLWPYASHLDIYQCPADPQGLDRSFTIPCVLWGDGWSQDVRGGTQQLADITNPSAQIVFLGESDTAADPPWNRNAWKQQPNINWLWIDRPGLLHGGNTADTFAFLDGHTEKRNWVDEQTIGIGGYTAPGVVFTPNNPDWQWVISRFRQIKSNGVVPYRPPFYD